MIGQSVWRFFGLGRSDEPAGAVRPAGTTVREAAGDRDEDHGWRPISQVANRDLTPATQSRMREMAVYSWEQHRISNRLIELPIAFILGDGVTIECDDPDAQAWLDAWWSDPITRMDLNIEKRMRELALFGEQVIIAFVRDVDGHVRHGALDPTMIGQVVLDPDNAALPIGIEVSAAGGARTYRIILDGDDAELLRPAAIALREQMTAGDCHFWRINDLLSGTRGRSDLLSAVDFADAYSELVFGEVERAAALRTLLYDVKLVGATEEQVQAKAASITPPQPGSIRVHNEAEEWNIITPKLDSADAAGTLRSVRNEVLGGGTIPEHWYGGGGDVNRATAAEMDEPTYRVFRRRQVLWMSILEAEARHVIRCRLRAMGRDMTVLAEDPDFRPRVVFPEMQSLDVARYAQALAQAVAAVVAAVSAGLLSAETAVRIIASIAENFGVEIDPAEELKKAMAAREKEREADAFRMPADPAPADPAADPADGETPPAGGDAS